MYTAPSFFSVLSPRKVEILIIQVLMRLEEDKGLAERDLRSVWLPISCNFWGRGERARYVVSNYGSPRNGDVRM